MSKKNLVKFQEALEKSQELSENLMENMKADSPTGKLADDELEKVGGGLYDGDGRLIVTIAYGCQYWEAGYNWIAVQGQCGSCKHMIGDSIYSYCNNSKNNGR